jgi:hypothetical protein
VSIRAIRRRNFWRKDVYFIAGMCVTCKLQLNKQHARGKCFMGN